MSDDRRQVRVMFDGLVERWEVSFVDADATSWPGSDGDHRVGRDLSGSPVEVVIDRMTLTAADLALIAEVFGSSVADLMSSLDPVSVDLVIAAGAPSTQLDARSVPQLTDSGAYVVSARSGGSLEVSVRSGSLRIRLPGRQLAGGWVTVSVATSGQLVALAPVRDDDEHPGSSVAEVPFGLDLGIEDLSIDVTDQPLAGDDSQASSAVTPRRRRRWWVIGSIVVVIAAVAAGMVLFSNDEPVAPGVAGPSIFGYADGDSVTATLLGPIDGLEAGSELRLSLVVSVRELGGYGPPPGSVVPADEQAEAERDARQVCLSVTDLPLEGPTMSGDSRAMVSLVRVDDAGVALAPLERVNLDSLTISAPFVKHTSVKQACLEARLDNDMFMAATDFVRDEVIATIELPDQLAPGRWRVDLALDDRLSDTSEPLIITVSK